MKTYLVEGHSTLDRVDAESWDAAEAKLAGAGTVIGELVEESKSRAMAFGLIEIKFAEDGTGAKSFTGYGAIFGNIDQGGDKILPGAFTRTLHDFKSAGRLPTMYYQHGQRGGGPTMPVGVWTNMGEDSRGLYVEGKLADTTDGSDLYVLLKAGAIGGLSIGYRVREFARPSGEGEQRQLKALDLIEVSLVNDPMNPLARLLSVKSADEIITIRDLEDCLRDAGLSRNDAVRVCARFHAKSNQREADADAAAIADMIRKNIATLSK